MTRPVLPIIDCPNCEGDGNVYLFQRWSDGMIFDKTCEVCNGRGEVPNPDHDPSTPSWYCDCKQPSILIAGECCNLCNVEIPEGA